LEIFRSQETITLKETDSQKDTETQVFTVIHGHRCRYHYYQLVIESSHTISY